MPMVDAKTETLRIFIQQHRTQPRLSKLDDDGVERWQAILEKTEHGVLAVATEVNAVMNDLTLTQQGQLQKRAKIGPRVVGNFSNLGVVLNQADQAKARLERVLFDPLTQPATGNEVVKFLKDQELRRTIGKGEAAAEFLKAVERGDVDTCRALLTAPGPSWVSDEILQRGKAAYAENVNHAGWEKLQYVEYLREHLSSLAGQVAQWLLHLGATPESIQAVVKTSKE